MVSFQIKLLQQQNIKITNNQYKKIKIMRQKYFKAFQLTFRPLSYQAQKYQHFAKQLQNQNCQTDKFKIVLPKYEYKLPNTENKMQHVKIQFEREKSQKLLAKRQSIQQHNHKTIYPKQSVGQYQSQLTLQNFAERKKNLNQSLLKKKPFRNFKYFKNQSNKFKSKQEENLNIQSEIKLQKSKHFQQEQNKNSHKYLSTQLDSRKLKLNRGQYGGMIQEQQSQIFQGRKGMKVNKQRGVTCEASQQFESQLQLREQKRKTTYKVACYLIEKKPRDTPVMMQALNLMKRQYVNNNLYMMIRRGLNIFKDYAGKHAEDKNLYSSLTDTSVLLEVIRLMSAVKCDTQMNFVEFRRILLILYLDSEKQKHPYKLTPDDLKHAFVLFRDIYKLAEREKR